jgi:4'-phosphopantetheinyl transferase
VSALDRTSPIPTNRAAFPDVEVVFVDLEAARSLLDACEAAVPRLSPADIVRAGRMAEAPERRTLWRSARIATRIVLERAAGPGIRKRDFLAEGGRPALGRGLPHFNVSHSGTAALIAVAGSDPVGVDIEQLRPLGMAEDRRLRIVAAAARRSGGDALDPRSDAGVLRAWVRLEAEAKALGSGIGQLLTEEGVVGGNRPASGMAASPVAVRDLDVPSGYVAALCGMRLPATVKVTAFPIDSAALAEFLEPRSRAS